MWPDQINTQGAAASNDYWQFLSHQRILVLWI